MSPIPENGVSPIVKISVVILTVLTVVAFSVFFFKLVGKVTSSKKAQPWALELRGVGDKLKDAGLNKQAVAQYKKFLEHGGIDLKTRAVVSQTLGKLYVTLGDCDEALVWFYQAEAAGPAPADKDSLDSQITKCLGEVQSRRP